MSSTNKTSLGLNMWEASDKPVRQDFVNDNVIINEKVSQLSAQTAGTINLGTGNAIYYYKRGNNIDVIVDINFPVTIPFPGDKPYIFGQLPQGFRPPGRRYINCYGTPMLIQILTDGMIVTYQGASKALILGQCSYCF